MQNTHYQIKHPRGSSPHAELEQGLDNCPPDRTVARTRVRGLRSIEENPKDSQRGGREKEFTVQKDDPGSQSDDNGRWQDDGGESG